MREARNGRSRFVRFIKSNGVYLALAVSLMAVGGVAIAGVGQELFHDASDSSDYAKEPVERPLTGQTDDRTTTTIATTTATTVKPTTTTADPAPDLYVLPLTNTVQKPFSVEAPLYSETMGDWRIHNGVDFAGRDGQAVKAIARGTVSSVEQDPMWGGVVTVDHGVGVISRYCGLSPSVRVGDAVDAGDPIGELSTIPCECAQTAHLHLEITLDGQPMDPVEVLGLEMRYADSLD